MSARLLLAFLGLLLIGFCSQSITRDSEIVSANGTIKYSNLEGGFYYIAGDDRRNYDPINLGAEFKQDGLRVRFRARVRTDMASVHMFGEIVEILEIGKL
jgi:hypothetical protein